MSPGCNDEALHVLQELPIDRRLVGRLGGVLHRVDLIGLGRRLCLRPMPTGGGVWAFEPTPAKLPRIVELLGMVKQHGRALKKTCSVVVGVGPSLSMETQTMLSLDRRPPE